MTRMTPLLERNEQFARTYTPAALGIPARQRGRGECPPAATGTSHPATCAAPATPAAAPRERG